MTEIVDKRTLEKRDSRPIKDHSSFDNSYRLAGTYRFGEYAPTMAIDVIPDDHHGIRSRHSVDSYTMKQPLLQNILLKQDDFLVPYSALIPRHYEKYITVPNVGDDVNADNVGMTVKGFIGKIYTVLNDMYACITTDDELGSDILSHIFKYLVVLDTFASSGSMFNALGCPLTSHPEDVDSAIDHILNMISEVISEENITLSVIIGDDTYCILPNSSPGVSSITLREFWNRIHDTNNWSVNLLVDANDWVTDTLLNDFNDLCDVAFFLINDDVTPIDTSRFGAYQISCAHFYSNDKVDYIYSATLWREALRALLCSPTVQDYKDFNAEYFTWNGLKCFYDEFSAYAFDFMFDAWNDLKDGTWVDFFDTWIEYSLYLFAYRRSLRFVDYFTGSRTRPLAPGDTTVTVKDGGIDIVESIQTKWYIRLWSQISRVGRKLGEQMKGLFPGVEPSIDWHDPIYIHGSDAGSIYGEDVENTSSEQFSPSTPIAVTSKLSGGLNGDFIDLSINDRYGVVISIVRWDISRFYFKGIDRTFFNIDRYDRFSPFLQFMGDQKVYLKELNADAPFSSVFAYQGKYFECKERLNRAFGGFVNNSLPGMVFLADIDRDRYNVVNQSPAYIRSYQCELDRFFITLSGWSLGTYFHFIMVTDNEIDSNRPMAYNPQIQ